MKKISISIIALLLLQIVFCSCGNLHTKKVNDNHNNDGTIEGVVVEKANNDILIEDAKIFVESKTLHVSKTTKTDDRGRFELTIPKGEYTLSISAQKHKEYKQKSLSIKSNSTNNLGLVQLDREYVAEELIKKPVKEIVELMDNKFTIDEEIIQTLYYFHNYDKFPGIDFHFSYSKSEDKDKIKKAVKAGEIEIEAIQVNGKGGACYHNDKLITTDLDYKTCTAIYGKMDCEPSNGAVVSGMLTALGYYDTVDGVKICINFELNNNLEKLANKASESNGKVKYNIIIKENPGIKNIVIKKDIQNPKIKITSKTMKDHILKGYWVTYDSQNNLVYAIEFKSKEFENGYKLAENYLYHVQDGELVKDGAIDNPSITNYKVKRDKIINIGEGGTKSSFLYTDDKNIIIQKSYGKSFTYFRFDSLPDFSTLKNKYKK